MKTSKYISLSSCCNYKIAVCPASFGDPTLYFCDKCNTECEPKVTEVQTHEKISKGHYRPIDNSNLGI